MTDPGKTGDVLSALASEGRFRHSPYPSVILGWVEPCPLERLAALRRREPRRFEFVRKIMVADRVVEFERDDVTEALCAELESAGPRLRGRSFYVRARLRGLKGRLETPAVERALGAFLVDRAQAAGGRAVVAFDDPDVVVAVEVVGKTVGYAFLDRERRDPTLVRSR